MIPLAPGTLTVVVASHYREVLRFMEGLTYYAGPGLTLRMSYLKRGPLFDRNLRLIRSESSAVFLWMRPHEMRGANWAYYVGCSDFAVQIRDSKPEVLKGQSWVE